MNELEESTSVEQFLCAQSNIGKGGRKREEGRKFGVVTEFSLVV